MAMQINPFTGQFDKIRSIASLKPYFLYKPGIAGGQTAYGGTGAGDNLTLYSTTHATKGVVAIPGTLQIGTTRGVNIFQNSVNELLMQNSVAGDTYFRVSPKTSGRGFIQIFNTDWNADHSNYESAEFGFVDNAATFYSSKLGTGTLRPMRFIVGTDRNKAHIYIDTTGKVGLSTSSPTQRLELYNGNLSFDSIDAPGACTAALAGVAGNVDNGTHIYRVTFRSSYGETGLGTASNTITVTDKTADGKVLLTGIPVAASIDAITQRRIYRTKAGGTDYFLVDTINNNVDTTYTDNTADADLTAVNPENALNRDNTINGKVIKDGFLYARLGGNMSFGRQALQSLDGGFSNLAIGGGSLYTLTSGAYNCCLGSNSGYKLTSGQHNMFIGTYCGYNATTGSYNIAVGNWALGGAALTTYGQVGIGTSSLRNNNANGTVAIGYQSGYYPANILANASVTDTWCTYLGAYTGNSNTTPLTGAVAIGYYATVGANYTIALGGTGSYASKVVIGATTANATLDVRGSFATAVAVKSGNYTLTANDHTVKFTATATATLPAATGTGIIYVIMARGGDVTIDANGSETINGELTQTLIDGETAQIQDTSTGTWDVL